MFVCQEWPLYFSLWFDQIFLLQVWKVLPSNFSNILKKVFLSKKVLCNCRCYGNAATVDEKQIYQEQVEHSHVFPWLPARYTRQQDTSRRSSLSFINFQVYPPFSKCSMGSFPTDIGKKVWANSFQNSYHYMSVCKNYIYFFFWASRNSTISRSLMNRQSGPLPLWRVTWGWRCAPPRSPAAGWPALWWRAVPRGWPSAWTLKHRKWRETRRLGCHLHHRGSTIAIVFLERLGRTYEVVVHSVLLVILRDGVFPIDDLQLGPLLEWVLLETQ